MKVAKTHCLLGSVDKDPLLGDVKDHVRKGLIPQSDRPQSCFVRGVEVENEITHAFDESPSE
jgi:hypothetical protein